MQWPGHWAADRNLITESLTMKNEPKTKKGFFGMLRESFTKTGGCCCGPGETCGGPTKESDKPQTKGANENKDTSKSAQK